jgi:phosphohistidine phosphatase SixA
MLKIPEFENLMQRVVSQLLANPKPQIHKLRLAKHLPLFLALAIRTVRRVVQLGRSIQTECPRVARAAIRFPVSSVACLQVDKENRRPLRRGFISNHTVDAEDYHFWVLYQSSTSFLV